MKIRNCTFLLAASILTVAAGIALFFENVWDKWYLVLLAYVACCSLAAAISKRAPIYFTLCFIFAGAYLCASFGAKYWAIIPLCASIGLAVTHLAGRKRFNYIRTAAILFLLSAVAMAGCVIGKWNIFAPVLIIMCGVITAVFVAVNLTKNVKKQGEDDYHVRPSKENKEDL